MKKTLALTIAILLIIPSVLLLSGCASQTGLFDFDPSDYISINFNNIRLDSAAVEEAIEELTNRLLDQSGSYIDPGRPLRLEDRINFEFNGVIDFVQLDREIQYGDHINFSYIITVQGEESFPQDRVHYAFREFEEDGDGNSFLDLIDFDSHMVGQTPEIGESISFDIVIPDNFSHAPVREKDAVIEVTIYSHFTGEFFSGGSGRAGTNSPQRIPFIIGGEQFIPGFEEEMIGHNVFEPSMVHVSFPEDYNPADLAGAEAVFFTYTTGVWVAPLEFTDEIVEASNWQWDTAEELHVAIREAVIVDLTVEYLLETTEFSSFPESEYQRAWDEAIEMYTGIKHDENFESFGEMANFVNPEWTTDEDFYEFYLRPQIEEQIKIRVIFYYLGRELNFVHDEDEVLRRYRDAEFTLPEDFEVSEDDIYNEMMSDVLDWLIVNVTVG